MIRPLPSIIGLLGREGNFPLELGGTFVAVLMVYGPAPTIGRCCQSGEAETLNTVATHPYEQYCSARFRADDRHVSVREGRPDQTGAATMNPMKVLSMMPNKRETTGGPAQRT